MSLLNSNISGTGEVVVFLHGFMEDASVFSGIVSSFPDKTCISVDLFGHGESGFDDALEPAVATMAEQVIDTLTELRIDEYAVVGHSLGGYVALELLKKDIRVSQVVLLHSHPWDDSPEKKKDRDRVIEMVQTKSQVFINEAIPGLFRNPQKNHDTVEAYKKIASLMRPSAIAWAAAAMRDRESNVNVMLEKAGQCAMIQGRHDKVVPMEKIRELSEQSGIPLVVLPDDAHMSQAEHPQMAYEALRAILG